jgi:hypothetical protein
MSGPSATQIQLQAEEAQFYQEGMQESQVAFAEDQGLLKQMEAVYSPILAKGPNTNAFAGAEQTALDAQAIQGTATSYTQASRAVGEQEAAEGGGDNPLPSGAGEQAKEQVANTAAGVESAEEEQVLAEGYSAGEHEFEEAGSALSTASGQLSPTSYESAATGAGSAAETTANQINQEENSWVAPVLGAVGAVGGAVVGENPGGVFD